jgi:SAM-dependent methyltransferase
MQPKPVSDDTPYPDLLLRSFRGRYEAERDSWTTESAMRKATDILLDAMTSDRHHVLDVGAGRGRDLVAFLAAGHRATGIDIVAPDNWPEIRGAWGAEVTLVETSLVGFEPAHPFTAALDNGCFHHQHPGDYAAYLARLREVLVPGSPVVVSVFTPDLESESGALHVLNDGRFNAELSEAELRAHLHAAGFEWIRSVRVPRPSLEMFYLVALVRRS